jgi:hypothetical protein
MRAVNRKANLIIFVSFIAYVLFLLFIVLALKEIGVPIAPISANALTILTVAVIILSAISCIAPWIIRGRKIQLSNQPRWFFNHVDPNNQILFLGYIFLVSPVIYGLILYFAGSSILLFYGFLSVSVVIALIWSLANSRQV